MRYTDLALDAKTLANVTPSGSDVACPSCGARLCWGGKVHLGADIYEARAHCILSNRSGLGRVDCDWSGRIRMDARTGRSYAVAR